VNLTYTILAEGRDKQGMRELDLMLTDDPQEREKVINEANMEYMASLQKQIAGATTPGRRRR